MSAPESAKPPSEPADEVPAPPLNRAAGAARVDPGHVGPPAGRTARGRAPRGHTKRSG